jgi:hypothetical protein
MFARKGMYPLIRCFLARSSFEHLPSPSLIILNDVDAVRRL